MPHDRGFIYFCKIDEKNTKIGFTNSIKNTLQIYHRINPSAKMDYYFEVNDKLSAEKLVHKICNPHRIEGEIFCIPKEIIQFAEIICINNGLCVMPMDIC